MSLRGLCGKISVAFHEVRIAGGAFITFLAIDGGGYVRIVAPGMKGTVSLIGDTGPPVCGRPRFRACQRGDFILFQN